MCSSGLLPRGLLLPLVPVALFRGAYWNYCISTPHPWDVLRSSVEATEPTTIHPKEEAANLLSFCRNKEESLLLRLVQVGKENSGPTAVEEAAILPIHCEMGLSTTSTALCL